MNRHAVLLDFRTGTASQGTILTDFARFLSSSHGGGWSTDEVAAFVRPSPDKVDGAIRATQSVDFALVLVIGSGGMQKSGRPWAELAIKAPLGMTYTERSLNAGAPRCLMLFDCTEAAADGYAYPTAPSQNLSASRRAFEQSFSEVEGGLVKVLFKKNHGSSSPSHTLAWHLMHAAHECSKERTGILYLDEVVSRVQKVAVASGEPTPIEYFGGRRLRHFPFAVLQP